jgi:hypothetical protein
MTSFASGNHYYRLNTITQQASSSRPGISTISLEPTKVGDAEAFLKKLHQCIRENNTINLPEGTLLNKIVDRIVFGYQSKLNGLSILQRTWQRFSVIITYPLGLLGINLTQAQRIEYYVKTIKVSVSNQSILISDDPAYALKKKLINALPINSPDRTKVLRYSIEECLEKMTNSDPKSKFVACKSYLKRGDIAKASDLLLGLNKEDELNFIPLFSEAIFICIEREIPVFDLIKKMSGGFISDEILDGIASKCNEAGKLEQFVAAINPSINAFNSVRFYDAVVKEHLKKIDSNELASRSGKPHEQTHSEKLVEMLHGFLDKISPKYALEVAKLFIAIEDYPAAIQAANLSSFCEEGRALLIEISSLCTKKGQFQSALMSLKKISFLSTPSSVKAFAELISRCNEAEKLDQLIAGIHTLSINKNDEEIFYNAFVSGCLREIDLNELSLRSCEQQQQTESKNFVKILHRLLDKISYQYAFKVAKLFIIIEDYPAAIQAVNLGRVEHNKDIASLVEISSLFTKKGQFELALKSLEKTNMDMSTPSIAKAFVELIVASIEVDLDFAYKVLTRFKHASQMKKALNAPAELIFERAMAINNFRVATDTLMFITLGKVLDDLSVERCIRLLAACPKDLNNIFDKLPNEIACILPIEARELMVNKFIFNKDYESAIIAISREMSSLNKFAWLMQISNECMVAEKYDLVFQSLIRMSNDTKKIGEQAVNELIDRLIEACLQNQLHLLTSKILRLVPNESRIHKEFIGIVDDLFSYGIKNYEYSMAINALGALMFKIEGQDLKELHQLTLERLLKISSLIEFDKSYENLKRPTASYITNCKKLLEMNN